MVVKKKMRKSTTKKAITKKVLAKNGVPNKEHSQKMYVVLLVTALIIALLVIFAGNLKNVGQATTIVVTVPDNTNLTEIGSFDFTIEAEPFEVPFSLSVQDDGENESNYTITFNELNEDYFSFVIENESQILAQDLLLKTNDLTALHLNTEDADLDLAVKMNQGIVSLTSLHVDLAALAILQDPDGDGIRTNDGDNCPDVANIDQEDTDGDGIGDVCDDAIIDTDGDGIADDVDLCTGDDSLGDADGDGICDVPTQFMIFNNSVSDLENISDELEEEFLELEDNFEDATEDLDEAIADADDNDIEDAEDELLEIENDLDDLLDEVQDELSDLDDLDEEIKDAEKDDEITRQEEDDLRDRLKNLEDDLDDLLEDIRDILGIVIPDEVIVSDTEVTCTQSWSCTDYSVCSSGLKERVCARSDDCDAKLVSGLIDRVITISKPSERQSCVEASTTSETDLAASVCTANSKRCLGSSLQRCSLDGSEWTTVSSCSNGCDSVSLSCKQESSAGTTQEPSSDDNAGTLYLTIGIILLVALGILAGAFVFIKTKKDKGLKGYIEETRMQGFTDSQIKKRLLEENWSEKKIDHLMK